MSKNNPAKRGKAQGKMFNDKEVKPVLYDGSHVGHGKYMAVQFVEGGSMAFDKDSKPIMWDSI
jgi:hypothetical protein